jgi:hypothetical protein
MGWSALAVVLPAVADSVQTDLLQSEIFEIKGSEQIIPGRLTNEQSHLK